MVLTAWLRQSAVLPAGLLALLTLCLAFARAAHAAEYFVNNASASCSDTGPGTVATPYCTISGALTAHHEPGVVLTVMPGRYREQVTFPASGLAGSPITLRGQPGAIVDGTDDFSDPARWAPFSGDVWLAASVAFPPVQVFADDQRLTASTAPPASLPARSFTFVAGSGLYVNAGGGNPGPHRTQIGRRLRGIFANGRSYLVIQGFTVTRCEDRCIQLTNTSNIRVLGNTLTFSAKYGVQSSGGSFDEIVGNRSFNNAGHGFSLIDGTVETTIEDNEAFDNADPDIRVANGLFVGASARNVIRRNRWHHNQDSGEQFSPDCADNVSLLNLSWANGDHGYDHNRATGTLHLHDVAYGNFKDGFSVEGTSTGTRLFNCISIENGVTTDEFDLWVDEPSTVGFQSNDNVLWNSGPQPPVRIGGSVYPTVSAYAAARGQDSRSAQVDPLFVDAAHGDFHLRAGSPAIDNANSGVAGWPSTDAEGQARYDDPGTPNRGIGPVTFADRGALEFQGATPGNLPPVAQLTATPSSGTPPLAVRLDASASSDPDGSIVSYQFDFGDGSGGSRHSMAAGDRPRTDAGDVAGDGPGPNDNPLDSGDAATVGPQPSPVADHIYAAGTWIATVTVTDDQGATDTATVIVITTANRPPVARLTATPSSGTAPLAVQLDASASSDPDGAIASYFFDFGDGATTGPHPSAGGSPSRTDSGDGTAADSQTSPGVSPNPFDLGGGATTGLQSSPVASHTYLPGTWTATVTVTDDLGATATDTAIVTVVPDESAPVARLTATPSSGTAPLAVRLDASASSDPHHSIISYLFDFGDGATAGPQPSAVTDHTYAAGNWTATVTVTDDLGATATASATVTVDTPLNLAPTAALSATPSAGPAPLAVQLDASASSDPDGSIVSYRFDFGDGATAGPQATAVANHTYAAGTWTATVTVTDDKGDTATTSAAVTANAPNQPPTAALSITPSSGAAPLSVSASASASSDPDGSIVSYFFDFGDGTSVGPQASPTAGHTYAAGHWTARVDVTDDDGARASAVATVDASGAPVNLVGNPSFETNTKGWAGSGEASISRVSGGHTGGFSARATAPPLGLVSYGVTDFPNWVTSTPGVGTRYHVRAWVRAEVGTGLVSLTVREFVTGGGSFTSQSSSIPLGLEWAVLDLDVTTRLAASALDMTIVNSPSAVGSAFRVDDISITLGGGVPALMPALTAGVPEPEPAGDLFLAPGVHPNPVRADGARIVFTTDASGPAQVAIFDLAGRVVRRLAGDLAAAAGTQFVTFDGQGDDGRRLPGGVYYYQLRVRGAVTRGRFVIVE